MKGLIVKELIEVKKRWIITTIMILVFSICSITGALPTCLILPMLLSAVVFGSFVHEEQSKWRQYAIVMPYGRKKYVSSKYLMQILSLLFSMVIIAVLWVISSVKNEVFDTGLLAVLLLSACVVGLIYPLIIFPVTMAFSSSTSRFIFLFLNGVIGGLSGITITDDNIINAVSTSKITSITPFIILAVIIALYLLSWVLSIKIYEKRDL